MTIDERLAIYARAETGGGDVATIELPEGVEIGEFNGYPSVIVDGVKYAETGEGWDSGDFAGFAVGVRRTNALESAEQSAQRMLSREPYTRDQAEAAAGFVRELVLEPLLESGVVTDPELLRKIGWKVGLAVTPLIAKFAEARELETHIGTYQEGEVYGGPLENALDGVLPGLRVLRARI